MGCGDNTTIGEQVEPRKPRIPLSSDQIDQVGTTFATQSLPGQITMRHNNVRMNISPSQSWALSLALYLNDLTLNDVERISGFDVEHVTERMRAVGEEPEGILSDIRLSPDIISLWFMSLLH